MKTRTEYILFVVLLVIFAIVLVVGGRLVSGDSPEQRYDAALEARESFFGHELLDIPDDEKLECMRWACGEDFLSAQRNTISDRWRDLHPDLPVIYDSDSVEHGYKIIGDEWKRHKAALADLCDDPNEPVEDLLAVNWDAEDDPILLTTYESNEPNLADYVHVYVLTPEPTHRCPVHGDLGTIWGSVDILTVVDYDFCGSCAYSYLRDVLKENIPQITKIDTDDTEKLGKKK